uniref:Neur_chan_LBD domain-containing protein n=1 Tax=Macrostomum lignano TaxID=282301 RepID=A0A1I8I068_9PLAT
NQFLTHQTRAPLVNVRKSVVDNLLTGYTRQNSPNGDAPTEVYIGIYIIGFYSISEATMDYALTVYLRLQWTDPRLKFNASQAGGRSKIKLGEKIWERIWVPDVFLRNEKKADFHSATIPNRLMNLESDGQIWYVIKYLNTRFPVGHTMETVIFKWLQPPKEPVEWPQDLMMPQFKIQGIHRKSCGQNYTTGPTLACRSPSMLTITTQASGSKSSLPRVSYIKAVDVWMSVCLGFVFASLLEFAIVNVYSRRDSQQQQSPSKAAPPAESPQQHQHQRRRLRGGRQRRQMLLQLQRRWTRPPTTLALTGETAEQQLVVDEARQGFYGSGRRTRLLPVISNEADCSAAGDAEVHQRRCQKLQPAITGPDMARRIDKFSRRMFPLSFLLFNVGVEQALMQLAGRLGGVSTSMSNGDDCEAVQASPREQCGQVFLQHLGTGGQGELDTCGGSGIGADWEGLLHLGIEGLLHSLGPLAIQTGRQHRHGRQGGGRQNKRWRSSGGGSGTLSLSQQLVIEVLVADANTARQRAPGVRFQHGHPPGEAGAAGPNWHSGSGMHRGGGCRGC